MEKGINFASKELEMNIKQIIGEADLPPCIVKNMLTNILVDVSRMEIQAIQNEKIEYEKNNKNKEEKLK